MVFVTGIDPDIFYIFLGTQPNQQSLRIFFYIARIFQNNSQFFLSVNALSGILSFPHGSIFLGYDNHADFNFERLIDAAHARKHKVFDLSLISYGNFDFEPASNLQRNAEATQRCCIDKRLILRFGKFTDIGGVKTTFHKRAVFVLHFYIIIQFFLSDIS